MRLRDNEYAMAPYPHDGFGGHGGHHGGPQGRGGCEERGHHDGHVGRGRRGGGPRGNGPGGPGGPRRGGRARRGDVRLALLSLLAEESGSGYALIKRIEEKTGGVWRTSPGSVYPTLSQLVDEGFVVALPTGEGETTSKSPMRDGSSSKKTRKRSLPSGPETPMISRAPRRCAMRPTLCWARFVSWA